MSKELIEKLREASYSASHGEMADLLHEAADALEAKAAPAGEREAFEAWAASVGYHTERDMFQREKYQSTLTWELWLVWEARAAYQRQQAREVVMPERQEPDDEWHYVMRERSHGWNACLDEFARLNKGAGSHE